MVVAAMHAVLLLCMPGSVMASTCCNLFCVVSTLRCISWGQVQSSQTASCEGCEVGVPYVLLAFKAEQFVEEVQRDQLASIMAAVTKYHRDCTLGVLVEAFDHYIISREQKEFKQVAPASCEQTVTLSHCSKVASRNIVLCHTELTSACH
jgi:hypothetical protein